MNSIPPAAGGEPASRTHQDHANAGLTQGLHEPAGFASDGTPVRLAQEIDDHLSTFELGDHRGQTLIERIVDGVIGAIGATCIVGMTLLVFGNAVSRYVFNESFIWADELIVAVMPWLAVCGVYLSIRQRQLIRIEYFVDRFPPRLRRVMRVGSDVFSAIAFGYLAIGGLQYLNLFGADRTLFLDLPTGWFTSALFIGSSLVLVAFLIEAGREAFAKPTATKPASE